MSLPSDFVARFWAKDGTLWSGGKYGAGATDFMGWLDVAEVMRGRVAELTEFATEVKSAGFERVVLAGMGGSSLAPLVLQKSLAQASGLPLAVLDSTDPATVLRIQHLGPVGKALFVIASKSGSTAEPNAFNDYFYDLLKAEKGAAAGENFVAITDPGSPFEAHAKRLDFRKIFLNFPDIGGRYSALSYFGLVPAALMGIDVAKLLDRALAVVTANKKSDAPAVALGEQLGEHAKAGRDKLTFILPDSLKYLGLWFEQLIAESTGKEGRGILPIALEAPGPPSEYGKDRVFAYIRPHAQETTPTDVRVAPLRDAGFPVVDIVLDDLYDIGAEFMRWEIATAVAGAVIEINPFDQPNVQESKDITKQYIQKLEDQGSLPPETATIQVGEVAVFGSPGLSVEAALAAFMREIQPGDYVCLQAYLTEQADLNEVLGELQASIRDKYRVPCTCGYGPRFLHSTGQFHKGGPNTGHFIQLTQADAEDALLPGKSYTFGAFRNAQYRGDADALRAHGRRVMRIELGFVGAGAIERLSNAVCAL
ncbi:MAG: glucose-6-phosphate isomerase [Fimbriimonadaceae bacterium]